MAKRVSNMNELAAALMPTMLGMVNVEAKSVDNPLLLMVMMRL